MFIMTKQCLSGINRKRVLRNPCYLTKIKTPCQQTTNRREATTTTLFVTILIIVKILTTNRGLRNHEILYKGQSTAHNFTHHGLLYRRGRFSAWQEW